MAVVSAALFPPSAGIEIRDIKISNQKYVKVITTFYFLNFPFFMVFFYNHNYGGIFFGGMVRK
jgi:hypothetical protein